MKYNDDNKTDIVRSSLERFLYTLSKMHGGNDISRRECAITFIGDSLMSDTMVAMECQLMTIGYKNSTECVFAHVGKENYYKNTNYVCNNSVINNQNTRTSLFQRRFLNLQSESCPTINLSLISNELLYEITTDEFINNFIHRPEDDNIEKHYFLLIMVHIQMIKSI
jgi:hypothetical protein